MNVFVRVLYMKGAIFLTAGFIITVYWSSLLFSFAQTTNAISTDIKQTSGGTLDVKLESTPSPIKSGQETNYKVTFLQKGTDTVQVHVDYDFVILKESGSYIIRVSVMGINFIPITTEFADFSVKVG